MAQRSPLTETAQQHVKALVPLGGPLSLSPSPQGRLVLGPHRSLCFPAAPALPSWGFCVVSEQVGQGLGLSLVPWPRGTGTTFWALLEFARKQQGARWALCRPRTNQS